MLTTVHGGCLRTNLLFPSWVHKELIWKLQIGPKAWHHGYTWNSNGYILLSLPFFGCVQQRAASLVYKFCYLCNTVGLKLWALFPVLLTYHICCWDFALGGIASICFKFHFLTDYQQTLQIQIQGSQEESKTTHCQVDHPPIIE